ncbi:MAG: hypothetical protein U1F60_12660 [Planctomycetota bacterium]
MSPTPRFVLQVGFDQDELLGARWWHEGLVAALEPPGPASAPTDPDLSRRTALRLLAGLGAGVVVVGLMVGGRNGGGQTRLVEQPSLDLQQANGLMFAANGASFAWPNAVPADVTGTPLDRSSLPALAGDLRPRVVRWQAFHAPTLASALQASDAAPLLRSIPCQDSPAMRVAHGRGRALRELLEQADTPERLLVVVDLPGPESVAFAAGLQPLATAVFQFANWPHPRGVVPAHETLAALLYHRPTFTNAPSDPKRPAVFVLDRNRLAPYANEPERFDNRYVVRLPTATTLRTMQIERIVYVVPEGAPEQELDDCNETFVAYRASGIQVRLVSAGDFQMADLAAGGADSARSDVATRRYYYGGSPLHHWWFWQGFGGGRVPDGRRVEPPTVPLAGARYQPTPRPLASSHLLGLGRSKARVADDRAGGASGSNPGGSWGRSHSGGFS